jgi:hypothetical protein
MRPDDLLEWNKAKPFVPYRIRLNSGRTYEIRHPEMIKIGRSTIHVYSFVDGANEVYDRAEMVGLLLIESIEPIDAPRAA